MPVLANPIIMTMAAAETGGLRGDETEITLIVCSQAPLRLRAELAALERLGDYELVPAPTQSIHDRFFDTPDRALTRARLALRIRRCDGHQWLTLKGPARITDYHALQRLEIERPWSAAALAEIQHELADKGVLFDSSAAAGERDALVGARRMGLACIEQHQTERQRRDVCERRHGRLDPMAELAIDCVDFQVDGFHVRHHELEIEQRRGAPAAVLANVSHALQVRFAPALRPWYHSKLAIALALRALMRAHALAGLQGRDLPPTVYADIDAYLRGAGASEHA